LYFRFAFVYFTFVKYNKSVRPAAHGNNLGMVADPILVDTRDDVAWVTINNPQQRNALDERTARAFRDCVVALAKSPAVRAVVLHGAGPCFGVGGNLRELQRDPVAGAPKIIDPMHEAITVMAAMNAPVIAAVHGAVAGGSLSLALACDFAVASEDARFSLAYANVGTSPDLSGSWSLVRTVGLRKAMSLALLNETLDARQAFDLGLVNRIVPVADLRRAAGELAAKLAAGPTVAYGRWKSLLRSAFQNDLERQLALERANFIASAETADFREGCAALLEKRAAKFNGTQPL